MPVTPLPAKPNLDHLKSTAKVLRDLVRSGVEGALDLVREHHPKLGALRSGTADAVGFKLTDAQLTLAQHHGFASWSQMVRCVEQMRPLMRSPHEQPSGEEGDSDEFLVARSSERSDDSSVKPTEFLVAGSSERSHDSSVKPTEFLRLACLNFGQDSPQRIAAALAMWRSNPALANASIYAAAACGDHQAIESALTVDPEAVNRSGGPFDWPPLLYATYSRLTTGDPAHDFVSSARVLLEHGADPNAGFLWDGLLPPFTALTGAVGRGEQGAIPHRDQQALMHLLLEAGADPNDGQLVYNAGIGNAQPRDDTDWLELLYTYRFGQPSNGPWFKRFGNRMPGPDALVSELLHDAARRGFSRRAALLLSRGADPNRTGEHPALRGSTPLYDAITRGFLDVQDLLVEAGAHTADLSQQERTVGQLLAGEIPDPEDSARVRTAVPDLIRIACELNKPIGVIRNLVSLGWDINAKNGTSALHEAAIHCSLETVRALVELGADPQALDGSYNTTPSTWAAHFGRHDIQAFLDSVTT
jgi:ankyrin repeat protein